MWDPFSVNNRCEQVEVEWRWSGDPPANGSMKNANDEERAESRRNECPRAGSFDDERAFPCLLHGRSSLTSWTRQ
jgi:hypothetical protein